MRVAIDYTPAARQRAGIGRYTRGLIRALADRKPAGDFLLLVAGGLDGVEADWPPNFRVRGLPLGDYALTLLWQRLRLPLPVEAFTGRRQVFHSPDFVLPPQLTGRSLLTVHDLSFLRTPQYANARQRAYLEKVVPRSVQRADLILADSAATQRDLEELLGVPGNKTQVLYPGIGPEYRPAAEAQRARVRAEYKIEGPFLLTVGTLEPRKNHPGLMRAFALALERGKLPHKLLIAGGHGWDEEPIFTTAERLGLGDRLRFLGFVPEADLPGLYGLAELFLYPSFYEGFGLPPLEAMACGVPVVTSDRASLPEVVGEAGCLVDPEDEERLAELILELVDSPQKRREMARRGLEQAGRFRWQASAQQLVEVYARLAS